MGSIVFNECELEELIRPLLLSPFVFLETAAPDKENKASFLFTGFKDTLVFNPGDNVEEFFRRAENFIKNGCWLSGYFSYEFGYWLEPALYHLRQNSGLPLVWLGVCESPTICHCEPRVYRGPKQSNHTEIASATPRNDNIEAADLPTYVIKNLKPNISRREYFSKIDKVKKYIEQGLTYETNFTFKIKFDFRGDILGLYLNLRRAQPTPYSALINTGSNVVLSLSPELFFRQHDRKIAARPMKGTFSRGFTTEEDRKNIERFKADKKIKAENLMIVDLLRNDLGRVCEKVNVSGLFGIERHPTLYQMTSTVEGKLKEKAGVKDIFWSLFPPGSVTGAPKIKTMEIIDHLEKEPRGIYTGAIGYISPQKSACFNVAIRTILLKDGKGELGVGGGIIYDSSESDEYSEALLKAKFLTKSPFRFSLIETILWREKKGYYLLGLHLKRLADSCRYFSIPLDRRKLKSGLKNLEKEISAGECKVRILISQRGDITIEKEPLEKIAVPVKIKMSPRKVDPDNAFLYHKTTLRDLYDKEMARARRGGFFEVIFLNTKGEVTEGSITNVFILKDGKLYTPPVKCGLLPGVLREYLLKEGKAREKVIYRKDILDADKVYIGNSVRGLLKTRII
jgi:para-aminobenzoate synthetase / 4-amino-4-deoxychorismate lyase